MKDYICLYEADYSNPAALGLTAKDLEATTHRFNQARTWVAERTLVDCTLAPKVVVLNGDRKGFNKVGYTA